MSNVHSNTALHIGKASLGDCTHRNQALRMSGQHGPSWELVPDSICTRNRQAPTGATIHIPAGVRELAIGRCVKGEGCLPHWPQISTYHCKIWMSSEVSALESLARVSTASKECKASCKGSQGANRAAGSDSVVPGRQKYQRELREWGESTKGHFKTPSGWRPHQAGRSDRRRREDCAVGCSLGHPCF